MKKKKRKKRRRRGAKRMGEETKLEREEMDFTEDQMHHGFQKNDRV